MKIRFVTALAIALTIFSLSTGASASSIFAALVVPSTDSLLSGDVDNSSHALAPSQLGGRGDDDPIFADGFDGTSPTCIPQTQTVTCSPSSGLPVCGTVNNNCGTPVNCGAGYCTSVGGTCNASVCDCPSNAYLCTFRPYCESQQAQINPCTHEVFFCNGCPPGGG